MVFVYDGGVVTDDEIRRIRLPVEELRSFKFVAPEALGSFVNDRNVIRIKAAMRALMDGTVAEADRT